MVVSNWFKFTFEVQIGPRLYIRRQATVLHNNERAGYQMAAHESVM